MLIIIWSNNNSILIYRERLGRANEGLDKRIENEERVKRLTYDNAEGAAQIVSEIEKILSHNNVPIIITNNGDNRFDNLNSHENIKVQIIKIPPLPENCNSFVNIYIVSQIMIKLQNEK